MNTHSLGTDPTVHMELKPSSSTTELRKSQAMSELLKAEVTVVATQTLQWAELRDGLEKTTS